MRTALEDNRLIVSLTTRETCSLNDGAIVEERGHPLSPEAKIEGRSLDGFEQGYTPDMSNFGGSKFLDRLKAVHCMARLFDNSDIAVYVPTEVSMFGFILAEQIERERIMGYDGAPISSEHFDRLPFDTIAIQFNGENR